MIRREHLAVRRFQNSRTGAEVAAECLVSGSSSRIAGLGVLTMYIPPFAGATTSGPCTYRITLTKAVAKLERDFLAHLTLSRATHRDVRYLARVIGAPVEVRAPRRGSRNTLSEGDKSTRITTVSP
jgi:hypothetical protein